MKHRHLLITVLISLLAFLFLSGAASAAEVRPLEIDPDTLDLNNGTFCLTVSDSEDIGRSGSFTASLFLEDRYDPAQIKALSPGDTVWMNGRPWTVQEIVLHEAVEPAEEAVIEIYPAEEYYGYLVFEPRADGTYRAVIDDWVPVSPVGEVRVMLPLPDRFLYVSISAGEEDDPVGADGFLDDFEMFGGFNAYNTDCVFENGELVKITHASYPNGPEEYWPGEEADEAMPVWQFFHGDPDLLDTAVIYGYTLDCEAGPIPYELPESEAEEIRTMALRGVVLEKKSDEMVTGGTWLYTFKTPEEEYIMTVEIYRGLLVGPDGMYAWELRR